MKRKQILIVISILLVASIVSYNFGVNRTGSFTDILGGQEHHSPPSVVIEPGSAVEEASYIIFKDDEGLVYAKNGDTGEVEYQDTNAATVINWALSSLTPGRTWREKIVLKGNFTLTDSDSNGYCIDLTNQDYTILDMYQAYFTLTDNQDATLFYSGSGGVTNLVIQGGEIDGNKANNNAGYGLNLRLDGGFNIFRDFKIHDCKQSNIKFTGDGDDGFIMRGVNSKTTPDYGIYLKDIVDSRIYGSVFGGWDSDVYIEGGVSIWFESCYFGGASYHDPACPSNNVVVDGSRNIDFFGCTFDFASQHALLVKKDLGAQNPPHQISVIGGRIGKGSGKANGAYSAVKIEDNSWGVQITHMEFPWLASSHMTSWNQWKYLIEESDTADYNKFKDNIINSGCYAIGVNSTIGANTVVEDNIEK